MLFRSGVNVLRTEGHDGNRWVLLDYGSVIVHVFTPEAHDFYDLEHLWCANCQIYDTIGAQSTLRGTAPLFYGRSILP